MHTIWLVSDLSRYVELKHVNLKKSESKKSESSLSEGGSETDLVTQSPNRH